MSSNFTFNKIKTVTSEEPPLQLINIWVISIQCSLCILCQCHRLSDSVYESGSDCCFQCEYMQKY